MWLPPFATAQQIVPANFDPDLAGAFITFKETLSFLLRLGVQPGRSLLILGSGVVGWSFTLAAKLIGATPVIVSGRRQEPLAIARSFGADAVVNVSQEDLTERVRAYTNGQGVAFAVEAVGDWEVVQTGFRPLAEGGQIGIYGVPPGRQATFDFAGVPRNWSLRFVQPKEEEVHQQVLDQLRLGLVDLRQFISHTVGFEEIRAGFDLVERKAARKVVVRIRQAP